MSDLQDEDDGDMSQSGDESGGKKRKSSKLSRKPSVRTRVDTNAEGLELSRKPSVRAMRACLCS